MGIEIECPTCAKRYRLEDKHAGRKGRCKKCGGVFQIPALAEAASVGAAAPSARPRAAVQRPVAQDALPNLDALADLEQAALRVDQSQIAYADIAPLPPPVASRSVTAPMPMAGGVPGMMPPGTLGYRARRDDRPAHSGAGMSIGMLWAVVGGLFVVGLILAKVAPAAAMPVSLTMVVLGLVLSLWGGIKFLIIAFQESAMCGLLVLLVPFYELYYLLTRWSETREAFLIALAGWAMMMGTSIIAAM